MTHEEWRADVLAIFAKHREEFRADLETFRERLTARIDSMERQLLTSGY
jgi:hypothetical protein